MKKIYLSLLLGAAVLGANAQNFKKITGENHPVSLDMPATTLLKTASSNTLTPPTFTAGGCATNSTNIVYYSVAQYTATATYTYDARGYAAGTNIAYYTTSSATYTINEKRFAQKYNVSGTGVTVTNVLIYAGKAKSDAATSQVKAMVYTENTTTKAPSTQTGAIASMALNSITPGSAAVFTFSTPVSVSAGNFFATIEAPVIGGATHDSLAILSTKVGCSTTDSLSWELETVNNNAGTWYSYTTNLGANIDLLIFPVIDIPTGVNSVAKGDLNLFASFPNPAANEVTINFGLNKASKVEIEIYDITGKLINTIKLNQLEAGNHSSKIDVSNLNSGVYMYGVKSESAQIFSKFTVAK